MSRNRAHSIPSSRPTQIAFTTMRLMAIGISARCQPMAGVNATNTIATITRLCAKMIRLRQTTRITWIVSGSGTFLM